ncbi:MAG: FliI/YscN family ATPase [bacterium]|nr:FliI/YscN family ATPase [bacterium]
MTTLLKRIESTSAAGVVGSVQSVEGSAVMVRDLPAPIGARVQIEAGGDTKIEGEVIGFRENETVVGLYGYAPGVQHRSVAKLLSSQPSAPAGDHLLGRVLDGLGRPIDDRELPSGVASAPLDRDPPNPLTRPPIDTVFPTGVAAIDGLLTVGVGQRVGLFAGAGVGKSVLLGMLARHCQADVIVIALVGERGREVGEFIQRDLGAESLKKSVVIVATSDQPAIVRKRAADTATAVAESFRDSGRNVLLLVDSLSRVALAGREIGLATGEPPAARGFPPSVFSAIPRLVERTGRSATGSITAFYTVLMEDETGDDPISDAVRGLLDGHVVLSRKLAESGHFPAIDIPASLSRVMPAVTSAEHVATARTVRKRIADYRQKEDLIHIGAYQSGSDPEVDAAIASRDSIALFAQQLPQERREFANSRTKVQQLSDR